MPEDARVQQQVHMHIWMEADIIMEIVSDARQAVKVNARFVWMQILNAKNQKIHAPRRVVSARGVLELRAIREVRCHPAREDHTHLDP